MKKTLVVLAAGMGSRFGGFKQITPVYKNGEFIIDYSVYDAKRSGFTKVVFVIRREMLKDFKRSIGKRLEDSMEVCYVFQENDDLLSVYPDLENRTKPLGTVQALLCVKDVVDSSFAIINADDFYGYDAYQKASLFMDEEAKKDTALAVLYPISSVSSEFGAVKRGVCVIENEVLKDIQESSIEKENNQYVATRLFDGVSFSIKEDTLVSMNLWVFQPSIFTYLEEYMNEFLQEENNRKEKEALLPMAVLSFIQEGKLTVKTQCSKGPWIGMTYKEDQKILEEKIAEFIQKGDYPQKLWD